MFSLHTELHTKKYEVKERKSIKKKNKKLMGEIWESNLGK